MPTNIDIKKPTADLVDWQMFVGMFIAAAGACAIWGYAAGAIGFGIWLIFKGALNKVLAFRAGLVPS